MILTLRASARSISVADPQQDELEDDIISMDGEGDDMAETDNTSKQQQPLAREPESAELTEEEKERKALLIGYARRLKRIQKLWGNETCADCYSSGPKWASILLKPETEGKLGVLVCDMCAVHHYSEVGEKRCKLKYMDYVHEWSEEALTVLETSGNALVNSVYEANLSAEDYVYYYDPENKNYCNENDEETGNVMSSDWRQAKFIKRKYKRDDFQDLDALEDALERVDKRITQKHKKTVAGTYEHQKDGASTSAAGAPATHDIGSISLRGTAGEAGETSTNANGNRRQSPLWNVFGLTRFNNKTMSTTTNTSSGRGSFTFRGLSTSLRGVAGEASSMANNLDTNNNNMKARDKLMKFFDVGMLELEDDYDVVDDDQALGYSEYDEEQFLYNDDSVALRQRKNATNAMDLVAMANDILTTGANTSSAQRRRNSTNGISGLQDVACRITGTIIESWNKQEDHLMDWIALTYPDINLTQRKGDDSVEERKSSTSHNRRRRSSVTTSTTRRRRSSSRSNPTLQLQRVGTVSSDRDLRKARANSSTRTRPSLHQAASESRLVVVAGRERSQSRRCRSRRSRHHSVGRLETSPDNEPQAASSRERRARSKSRRRRHSIEQQVDSTDTTTRATRTAGDGKERNTRSKSRRRRYSVESRQQEKKPLSEQQDTMVDAAASSEVLVGDTDAKPSSGNNENRRARSKSRSKKHLSSWSGSSLLSTGATATETTTGATTKRRVSSSRKGTTNRRRSSGSRYLMSGMNGGTTSDETFKDIKNEVAAAAVSSSSSNDDDDNDPTLTTLDKFEIAFLNAMERKSAEEDKATAMKKLPHMEQGLKQSKSARCVIDQTIHHDEELEVMPVAEMQRCTKSCSDLRSAEGINLGQ